MFQTIQSDERGVMYKNGAYAGLLMPGKHFTFNDIEVFKLGHYFRSDQNIKILLENKDLEEQLISFEVKDDQVAIYTIDGNFSSVVSRSGTYAVWKGPWKQEILIYDISEPFIEDKQVLKWCRKGLLSNETNMQVLPSGVKGMLYVDQKPVKIVEPGTYFVWRGSKPAHIVSVDGRQQVMELSGQELISKDKIMLRINFAATYQITDIEKALHNSSNYTSQIYNIMQLALRAYIGGYSLEDIFNKKDEISGAVLTNAKEACEAIGIKLISAGIKDIILPGEIKDI